MAEIKKVFLKKGRSYIISIPYYFNTFLGVVLIIVNKRDSFMTLVYLNKLQTNPFHIAQF